MKWLCQIRIKETDDIKTQTMIILRVFMISMSYCNLKGDHVEISIGMGPVACSVGMSIWKHLLP